MVLEILGGIGFDWQHFLFNIVAVSLLFGILSYFLYKPLMRAIEERQAKVEKSVQDFELAETRLNQAEVKAQEVIDTAKEEANRIIEKAHQNATEIKEWSKNDTEKEVTKMLDQAREQIEKDKEKMFEEFEDKAVEVITKASEKLVRGAVSVEADKKLVSSFVKELN